MSYLPSPQLSMRSLPFKAGFSLSLFSQDAMAGINGSLRLRTNNADTTSQLFLRFSSSPTPFTARTYSFVRVVASERGSVSPGYLSRAAKVSERRGRSKKEKERSLHAPSSSSFLFHSDSFSLKARCGLGLREELLLTFPPCIYFLHTYVFPFARLNTQLITIPLSLFPFQLLPWGVSAPALGAAGRGHRRGRGHRPHRHLQGHAGLHRSTSGEWDIGTLK